MLRTLHDTLIYWDHVAWYYLNTRWHNSFFDAIIPFFRNQWTWVPLYLFLGLYMPSKYKQSGWVWCLVFFISFVISDQVSATLMKPYFHRLRPCNNPDLAGIIHNIVPCGGGKSFPSSHAANHFAISAFSAITLSKRLKWIWPVAVLWAAVVSFSQVYVGVHYPLDVVCGGLLGAAIGFCTGNAFNRFIDLDNYKKTMN